MTTSKHRPFRHLPFALALAVAASGLGACAPSDEEGEDSESSESQLQTIGPDAMVGPIALGESVVVSYTKTPLYRVLAYHGTAGDHLEMKVTRNGVRAEDMRAWIAHTNGSVIRAGSRGQATADLDTDGDVYLVVRQDRLEDTTVLVTLTGAHASHPVFDLPAWALGRNLAVPIDCTVNSTGGATPFHVDGTLRVEPGTATQPRASLTWAGETAFADGGNLDRTIGHKLLTEDLATYYGARAPVGLFQDPASYGKAGSFGDRLVIEAETPVRFSVFFEYAQGSTPNVYKVHGPSSAMQLDPDGIAFTFARRGSNALDYPNHSIACHAKAAAPACATCAVPHPCAFGYTEVEGICTRPPAPVKAPRVFTDITAAPYSTCALDTGGKATCWGPNNSFVRPETFKQVVAGEKYHCGITTSDELSCWESYGQHVNWNTLPYETFSKIAIGSAHACGLRKSGGTARCWGSMGQTVVPTTPFVDIVAAAEHTCALDAAGAITCWGNDYRMGGAGNAPAGTFKKLSASPYLFCGLRDTGALVCWGSYASGMYTNMAGNPAAHDFGGNYVDLAAGGSRACGVDANHVVHCVGFANSSDPSLEGAMYTKIAFGSGHTCAIDVDGEAHCFGSSTAATSPPSP
ncbi:MAG: hypothetical protein JWP87_6425 [Labilithrix sp.]|nr:hypothetical protein [Labilithrix sp.]